MCTNTTPLCLNSIAEGKIACQVAGITKHVADNRTLGIELERTPGAVAVSQGEQGRARGIPAKCMVGKVTEGGQAIRRSNWQGFALVSCPTNSELPFMRGSSFIKEAVLYPEVGYGT